MENVHYLSSTYLKILVQANRSLINTLEIALGFSITELLSNDLIEGHDVDHIFMLFDKYGLDSWILRYGNQFGIASHGPLGFAVLSAPNLATAIDVAANYSIIRSSFCGYKIIQEDNRSHFIITSNTNNELTGRWMIESGLHAIKQLIETIVAHPLGDNAKITFAYQEPEYKVELEKFYGVKCEFGSQNNAIIIPSSWQQIRSPLSDQSTFKNNLRKCQELKLRLNSEQKLIDKARFTLNQYFDDRVQNKAFDDDIPSLTTLAQDNHMSARTFSRRLKEQNISYKKLLEDVRKEQASSLLKSTHLSITDISYRLGYQEPANFIRAFKQWYQCTPAQWRKKLA